MQRCDDAADLVARQRVIDRLRISPCRDDAFRAQLGEMLRERGLAEPDPLLQSRHGELALMELTEHHQTVAIGNGLQERFRPPGLSRQYF